LTSPQLSPGRRRLARQTQTEGRSNRAAHSFQILIKKLSYTFVRKSEAGQVPCLETDVEEAAVLTPTRTQDGVAVDEPVSAVVIRWHVPTDLPEVGVDEMDGRIEGDDRDPLVRWWPDSFGLCAEMSQRNESVALGGLKMALSATVHPQAARKLISSASGGSRSPGSRSSCVNGLRRCRRTLASGNRA
jgi:hypothetical protein